MTITKADLATVKHWFSKAATNAGLANKEDSAALWRDGLAWINALEAERDSAILQLELAGIKWDANFTLPTAKERRG